MCEEGHLSTHRCVQCEQFMCATTATMHGKIKATKDHDVQTITELQSSHDEASSDHKVSSRVVYCGAHPAPNMLHELTLFCKTCDIAVCRDCIIEDHEKPAHEVVFLAKVVGEQRKVITDMVADTELHSKTVGEAIEVVQKMQQAVAEREAEAEERIKRCCQVVYAATRAHEETMLGALRDEFANATKVLESQVQELEGFKGGLDSSCEYVRTTLRGCSDAWHIRNRCCLIGCVSCNSSHWRCLQKLPTRSTSIQTLRQCLLHWDASTFPCFLR